MSLATAFSRALIGISAPLVSVEAHISNGLPCLNIVGLPETAVRESKDRVRSAILNSNLDFPARRITVNLAPADLPKVGGRYDLAIAMSILAASGQVQSEKLSNYEFLGELALGGELRGVLGILPAAIQTRDTHRTLIVASDNGYEASLVSNVKLQQADNLLQIVDLLTNGKKLPEIINLHAKSHRPKPANTLELSAIKGQKQAKRALQLAAAGGHNLLMKGPPGTGKTMLAGAIPGILPDLTEQESLQLAAIRSVAGHSLECDQFYTRPFRSPHHTATAAALAGGGNRASPGEVSLAHNGVLFLDELPEFSRKVLEVLREPLESGSITISRANYRVQFPANFQLVSAMNPCPCGFFGDSSGRCNCPREKVESYLRKISGPLLDRIDLITDVPRLSHAQLCQVNKEQETQQQIKARIEACTKRQFARSGKQNSQLSTDEVEAHCNLDRSGQKMLELAMNKYQLSARGFHRTLRLARTIADLEDEQDIKQAHLLEALSFRGG